MSYLPPEKIFLSFFQIEVSPLGLEELIEKINFYIVSGQNCFIGGQNLHSVYLSHTDEEFKALQGQNEILLSDGFPVFLSARLTNHALAKKVTRIGSTDWIPRLAGVESLERVIVCGSDIQSNSNAVERLKVMLGSRIEVRGVAGASWNQDKQSELVACINSFAPQVLLLGLGMPLQERVAFILRTELGGKLPLVVALVGGAIDQISGKQTNAPRWLGRLGLEWGFRFITQPRRLFNRYFVEPWKLAWILLFRRGDAS